MINIDTLITIYTIYIITTYQFVTIREEPMDDINELTATSIPYPFTET